MFSTLSQAEIIILAALKFDIHICKCFLIGPVQIIVVWERVKCLEYDYGDIYTIPRRNLLKH